VQLSVDQIVGLASADPWDLGLPSALLPPDRAASFATSDPYYYWPTYLLVRKASTASSPTDLAGLKVCVMTGSSGEFWLGGHLDLSSGMAVAAAPASPLIHTEDTDWACLDALTNGVVDALVTSTLSDSDLAARPSFRTVGGPLFVEPRTIMVSREGPDPSALLSAIDVALGAMRSDGTLADLSRNRFGGRDLSIPPTTPEGDP
jgi:ABC-type amino acid transport substrate-binding protein